MTLKLVDEEEIAVFDAEDHGPSGVSVSAGQLRSITERVERLEEEKKEVQEQIKEVYAEAKANGFDTPTIKRLIKLRRLKPEEISERAAMLDLYASALGMQLELPLGGV